MTRRRRNSIFFSHPNQQLIAALTFKAVISNTSRHDTTRCDSSALNPAAPSTSDLRTKFHLDQEPLPNILLTESGDPSCIRRASMQSSGAQIISNSDNVYKGAAVFELAFFSFIQLSPPSVVVKTLTYSTMYSAAESIPTYSGINATLLAQAPSSGHQFMSDLSRSDGYPSNHLLGKSFSKKQKLAMCINTRHMAIHYPGVLHHQHDTPPNHTNQSFSFQEPQPQPSTGRKQSIPPSETSTIEDAAIKEMDVSSQSGIEHTSLGKTVEAVQSINSFAFGQNNLTIPFNTNNTSTLSNSNASGKVRSIIPTRQNKQSKPYAPRSHCKVNAAASNSQTIVHMAIRDAAQAKFLESVQRWTDAIKCICDVRKQQLEFELFDDEPTITINAPDLLRLLQDIEQKKNQITHDEEQATGLIKAIYRVLDICDDSTEKESIRLASNILDNLVQRFMGVRLLT